MRRELIVVFGPKLQPVVFCKTIWSVTFIKSVVRILPGITIIF